MRSLTLTLCAATIAIASPLAHADDDPFVTTFKLKGKYSNDRATEAELTITKTGEAYAVSRTARFTSPQHRRVADFTWTGSEIKRSGDTLSVTYTLGATAAPGHHRGARGVLEGETPGDAATEAPKPNVIKAVYTLSEGGRKLTEKLSNTTRIAPEDWWGSAELKGSNPKAGRLKLGHGVKVDAIGKFTLVIPTDGTLTLRVTRGSLELRDPNGKLVKADASGKVEIAPKNPVLGAYEVVVKNGEGGHLSCTFTQTGEVEAEHKPWTSTYYPIYEEGNANALFRKDGPLDKFDKALELTGKQSAVWWEKGGDYRTEIGLGHGHYVKVRAPKEKTAEQDWHADLDHDGVIGTTQDNDAFFKRHDTDGDGKITQAELKTFLRKRVIDAVFKYYDYDESGAIDVVIDWSKRRVHASSEIGPDGLLLDRDFPPQRTGVVRSKITKQEFERGVRTNRKWKRDIDGRTYMLVQRFMGRDENKDGEITKKETASGAIDFMDSSDVDGDQRHFFDRDNYLLTLKTGDQHIGNTWTRDRNDRSLITLFKGREGDQKVVSFKLPDEFKALTHIADGDLDDSYSVGWWGHCDAVAFAGILFKEPKQAITVNGVTLSPQDLKGLLVEYAMGYRDSDDWGWRKAGPGGRATFKSDREYAAGFHGTLHTYVRVRKQSLLGDMAVDRHVDPKAEVWNYSVKSYTATIKEAPGDDPYVLEVRNSVVHTGNTLTCDYLLHFDTNGSIREDARSKTEWKHEKDGKRAYVRYLTHPRKIPDFHNRNRNPNVSEERLKKIFGGELPLTGKTPTGIVRTGDGLPLPDRR